MNNLQNNQKSNAAPMGYDTLLAAVLVRFTYKDKYGVMGEDTVEISKRDSELAIATFEKKHPEIVWREFSFV
jgi:hypothetical protein